MTELTDTSQYLYGVIAVPDDASMVAAENTLKTLARTSPDEIVGGIDVGIVRHEKLAAIVSSAQAMTLGELPRDALAKMLLAHQKTIESIMPGAGLVIPFRLGTYVASKAAATDVLVKGGRLVCGIFDKAADKVEMDVAVMWSDFAAILKEIGDADEIRKCKAEAAANPKGVSVDDQAKIGRLVKNALDRQRMEIGRRIAEALTAVAVANRNHENMDDRMIMNAAFLVDGSRQRAFDRALDELDGQFAGKLDFRCVGPLAPYSFYTLEVKDLVWEDIDRARRLMGLGDVVSMAETTAAFRHSALATHPDQHHRAASEDERRFDDLTHARRVVLEYANACRQTKETDRIDFSKDAFRGNALLVKLKDGDDND